MPINSLRRRVREASRICPPGSWAASSSTTPWPPLRRHAGGLKSGRAGADHHHPARRALGTADDMRHGRFAAGGRVVDAQRLVALIDPVQAIGGTDAGPDLRLPPLGHLGRDMRVGDMGPGSCRPCRACPSAMAWRAVATSLMRAAWKTGNFVSSRTSPQKSRWGAAGVPWIGMTRARWASCSIWPRIRLRKSTLPELDNRRAISTPLLPAQTPPSNPHRRPCGCRR